jgi:phosphate uptake regulator
MTRWTRYAARYSRFCSSKDWSHGVELAVDAALIGRYYERFADHAVAIARKVTLSSPV